MYEGSNGYMDGNFSRMGQNNQNNQNHNNNNNNKRNSRNNKTVLPPAPPPPYYQPGQSQKSQVKNVISVSQNNSSQNNNSQNNNSQNKINNNNNNNNDPNSQNAPQSNIHQPHHTHLSRTSSTTITNHPVINPRRGLNHNGYLTTNGNDANEQVNFYSQNYSNDFNQNSLIGNGNNFAQNLTQNSAKDFRRKSHHVLASQHSNPVPHDQQYLGSSNDLSLVQMNNYNHYNNFNHIYQNDLSTQMQNLQNNPQNTQWNSNNPASTHHQNDLHISSNLDYNAPQFNPHQYQPSYEHSHHSHHSQNSQQNTQHHTQHHTHNNNITLQNQNTQNHSPNQNSPFPPSQNNSPFQSPQNATFFNIHLPTTPINYDPHTPNQHQTSSIQVETSSQTQPSYHQITSPHQQLQKYTQITPQYDTNGSIERSNQPHSLEVIETISLSSTHSHIYQQSQSALNIAAATTGLNTQTTGTTNNGTVDSYSVPSLSVGSMVSSNNDPNTQHYRTQHFRHDGMYMLHQQPFQQMQQQQFAIQHGPHGQHFGQQGMHGTGGLYPGIGDGIALQQIAIQNGLSHIGQNHLQNQNLQNSLQNNNPKNHAVQMNTLGLFPLAPPPSQNQLLSTTGLSKDLNGDSMNAKKDNIEHHKVPPGLQQHPFSQVPPIPPHLSNPNPLSQPNNTQVDPPPHSQQNYYFTSPHLVPQYSSNSTQLIIPSPANPNMSTLTDFHSALCPTASSPTNLQIPPPPLSTISRLSGNAPQGNYNQLVHTQMPVQQSQNVPPLPPLGDPLNLSNNPFQPSLPNLPIAQPHNNIYSMQSQFGTQQLSSGDYNQLSTFCADFSNNNHNFGPTNSVNSVNSVNNGNNVNQTGFLFHPLADNLSNDYLRQVSQNQQQQQANSIASVGQNEPTFNNFMIDPSDHSSNFTPSVHSPRYSTHNSNLTCSIIGQDDNNSSLFGHSGHSLNLNNNSVRANGNGSMVATATGSIDMGQQLHNSYEYGGLFGNSSNYANSITNNSVSRSLNIGGNNSINGNVNLGNNVNNGANLGRNNNNNNNNNVITIDSGRDHNDVYGMYNGDRSSVGNNSNSVIAVDDDLHAGQHLFQLNPSIQSSQRSRQTTSGHKQSHITPISPNQVGKRNSNDSIQKGTKNQGQGGNNPGNKNRTQKSSSNAGNNTNNTNNNSPNSSSPNSNSPNSNSPNNNSQNHHNNNLQNSSQNAQNNTQNSQNSPNNSGDRNNNPNSPNNQNNPSKNTKKVNDLTNHHTSQTIPPNLAQFRRHSDGSPIVSIVAFLKKP
jgi:hypothetical protein